MIYIVMGNKYLVAFNGPIPVWTTDKSKARLWPEKYLYEIKKCCYRANPDSELISSEKID